MEEGEKCPHIDPLQQVTNVAQVWGRNNRLKFFCFITFQTDEGLGGLTSNESGS